MDNTFKVNKEGPLYKWLAWYYSTIHYVGSEDQTAYYKWTTWNRDKTPVAYYEEHKTDRPYDFCQFWRHVLLWPAFRIGFNLVFFGVWGYVMSILIGLMITYPASAAVGFAMILAVFAFFALIAALIWLSGTAADKAKKVIQGSSFANELYEAHKNKICKNVEYVREEK